MSPKPISRAKRRRREVVAVMHKATADLSILARPNADSRSELGAYICVARCPGELVRSADLLARGPLVLTFYRGIWRPYCNMDLQAIEAAAAEIRALGASLVAISPQTAPNRRKSERENALSFSILSDHGNSVANEFGLRSRLPDDLIAVYKGFGNDLTVGNGEDSWTPPMPAVTLSGLMAALLMPKSILTIRVARTPANYCRCCGVFGPAPRRELPTGPSFVRGSKVRAS